MESDLADEAIYAHDRFGSDVDNIEENYFSDAQHLVDITHSDTDNNLHNDPTNETASYIFNSEDASTDEEQVILSVFWRKGMLGAASYNMESLQVEVMNDIVDVHPEFFILQSLLYQLQPAKVISSRKTSPKILSLLKSVLYGTDKDVVVGKDINDSERIILLPGKEYNYESCKRRVLSIKLPTEPDSFTEDEHLLYMYSLIDITEESMIQALGVLLKSLDKAYFFINLDIANTRLPVHNIITISLNDLVFIDSATYDALQIFSKFSHPSNFKVGSPQSSKEGLSVLGMFNRCVSKIGSNYMRVMFLHPTKNISILNGRLDVVQFSCDSKNTEYVKSLQNYLKNINNTSRITKKLTTGLLSVTDWKSLRRVLDATTKLCEHCSSLKNYASLFDQIADSLTEDLKNMSYAMNFVIDFQEMEKNGKFVVNFGVNKELDKIKHQYGRLSELMYTTAQKELEDLPEFVEGCTVMYLPEIGFVLSVNQWQDNLTENDIELPGLNYLFSTATALHYKSRRTFELDESLGDLMAEIVSIESRIQIALVQLIEIHISELEKVVKLAAELDCLLALGTVARENNYSRPNLTDQRVIKIENGRHVLQDICSNDFVPNDTFSTEYHGLVKILTGPNACGKSIYLKQVGLISFLAHIGSFVPASSATIGILDHIHSRIRTVESVATRISAFMLDIKQMALNLYCSTPSSLILIDEFGKGSSEIDGLALLTASLENFLSRENDCPHLLVSTHFHLVVNALPRSKFLTFLTFDCITDINANLIFLYKLKNGNVECSLALEVANLNGLKETIIKDAEKVLDSITKGSALFRKITKRLKLNSDCAETLMSPDFLLPQTDKLNSILLKNLRKKHEWSI